MDDTERLIDMTFEKHIDNNILFFVTGINRYELLADIGFGKIDSYEELRKRIERRR